MVFRASRFFSDVWTSGVMDTGRLAQHLPSPLQKGLQGLKVLRHQAQRLWSDETVRTLQDRWVALHLALYRRMRDDDSPAAVFVTSLYRWLFNVRSAEEIHRSYLRLMALGVDALLFLESSGPHRAEDVRDFLRCLPVYSDVTLEEVVGALELAVTFHLMTKELKPQGDFWIYRTREVEGQAEQEAALEQSAERAPYLAKAAYEMPNLFGPYSQTGPHPLKPTGGTRLKVEGDEHSIHSQLRRRRRAARRPGASNTAENASETPPEVLIGVGELKGYIRTDLYWEFVQTLQHFASAELKRHMDATDRRRELRPEQAVPSPGLYFRGLIVVHPVHDERQDESALVNLLQDDALPASKTRRFH